MRNLALLGVVITSCINPGFAQDSPAQTAQTQATAKTTTQMSVPQKRDQFSKKIFKGISTQMQHVAAAVSGDPSLPPSYAENQSWPFKPEKRAAGTVYHIVWSDGTSSSVVPTTGGGYSIIDGDAAGTTLTPIQGGGFAIAEDNGGFATMMPQPGGWYKIVGADGSSINVTPRMGGGYYLTRGDGVELGSLLPGPSGKSWGFGGWSSSFGGGFGF